MRKFFQFVGMFVLICFSFFYTEKTVTVVREMDSIMVAIKKEADTYKISAVDAKVLGNTVIPGMSGKIIDENLSYKKMKPYGVFTSNLLVYKDLLPKKSIHQYYDKYVVGGNPLKKSVSLIFLVGEQDDTTKIETILNRYQVKATFFIDGSWLEDNNEHMVKLIANQHVIGNKSYDGNYLDSSFIWMDTIIKRIGKQANGYCYIEGEFREYLDSCMLEKNHMIRPNLVVKEHPFKEVKEQVKSGSIISMKINDSVVEELPSILQYIKSKGYKMETISQLLKE